MRRDPTAARQRPGDQCDNAPIFELEGSRFGAAFGDLPQTGGDVTIRIVGKRAGPGTQNKKLAQRHAVPQLLTPQAVHFDVAHIAEHEPGRAVEHTQALAHVVERNSRQAIAVPLPGERDQSADRQGGKRQQHR